MTLARGVFDQDHSARSCSYDPFPDIRLCVLRAGPPDEPKQPSNHACEPSRSLGCSNHGTMGRASANSPAGPVRWRPIAREMVGFETSLRIVRREECHTMASTKMK